MRDGQFTLDDLRRALKKVNPDLRVEYAFGGLMPTGFGSYRGDYGNLALGFRELDGRTKAMTVAELIEECEEADGQTYQGYKGGDFKMSGNTPVWVANYGDSTGTVIVGVSDDGYTVRLETAYREY